MSSWFGVQQMSNKRGRPSMDICAHRGRPEVSADTGNMVSDFLKRAFCRKPHGSAPNRPEPLHAERARDHFGHIFEATPRKASFARLTIPIRGLRSPTRASGSSRPWAGLWRRLIGGSGWSRRSIRARGPAARRSRRPTTRGAVMRRVTLEPHRRAQAVSSASPLVRQSTQVKRTAAKLR